MADGFQPRRRGGAVATFTGFEADLLRSLASQLIELLRSEAAVPATEIAPGVPGVTLAMRGTRHVRVPHALPISLATIYRACGRSSSSWSRKAR